jgi:hypothetical protein
VRDHLWWRFNERVPRITLIDVEGMCAEGLVKYECVLGGLLRQNSAARSSMSFVLHEIVKSAIRSRQLQSKLSNIGSGNMVGLLGVFMLTDT